MPKQTKQPSILLTFPALISTERQVQRRRYAVKTRNIQVVYSAKLKQAYITANDNMRSLDNALYVFIKELVSTQKRIKDLGQAKDLKVLTACTVRIGTQLNDAKLRVMMEWVSKGYTVLNNQPRPKSKKVTQEVKALCW